MSLDLRLSYFMPVYNEGENIAGLLEEALAVLPSLAREFEIIAVDDGSRDRTAAIIDAAERRHPGVVRVVRHPRNLGYGAALRSGFSAARYEVIAYTDSDGQFKVKDLEPLLVRLAGKDAPDAVAAYRATRADPPLRSLFASLYRLALRLCFGLRFRDVDCGSKVFRRSALRELRVESSGAFFSAELFIKLAAARIIEMPVPHYRRRGGRATGLSPLVVFGAVRDFWSLRLRLWVLRRAAMSRGATLIGES